MTFNDTKFMDKVSTRHIKLTITIAMLMIASAAMAQRTDTPSSVIVGGSVFGGGKNAMVGGSCTVIINQDNATITEDVYGGGALAKVNTTDGITLTEGKSTSVTLMRGIVKGDLYGGGLGDNTSGSEVAADVLGPVTVTIEGGTVTGSVFGCNNLYGAPKNTVTVNVENDLSGVTMTLNNVYGGGNLAAYTYAGDYPKVNINKGTVGGSIFGGGYGATAIVTGNPKVTVGDLTDGHGSYVAIVSGDVYGGGDAADVVGTTDVHVQKCNTVINGDVYGGGNAADIVKNGETGGTTSVTVTGGTITGTGHGMVFGGGHGDRTASPVVTANVESSTSVTISGGVINKVFGGSNSAGTINGGNAGGISVLVNNTTNSCPLHIIELYGGGNYAASQVGSIDIRCTGSGENDRIDYVYGGANQADITGNIVLDITQGHIGNVFGGNNTSGSISGSITVNIDKDDDADCANQWYVGNVYGGGNHAPYGRTPDVNIINGEVSGSVYGGGNEAGVAGGDVAMTGGAVRGGVYGGCNTSGVVDGDITVNITGGTIGTDEMHRADVFGGGYGDGTSSTGDVTVNFGGTPSDHNEFPKIFGDIYGGSALGSVNDDDSDKTTVNILNGTLVTYQTSSSGGFPVYNGGNVFGGGLGVNNDPANADKGKVNGKVVVNIGAGTPDATHPFTVAVPANTLSGNATIGGNVYGCNNSGGSPQDEVTVNVFQTAHTEKDMASYLEDDRTYAIANVFGGGNEANFSHASSSNKTYVNIYTCNNTIGRLFGGGNAAATPEIVTHIQGGRFSQVFGGGNGERGAQYGADVYGDVSLYLHGGDIGENYGGSNQNGTIHGDIHTNVLNDGPCESVTFDEFFCGGYSVDVIGDLVTTIDCSEAHYTSLYGGCNQANVYGNIILNLCGGTYTNVFGGSKGVADGTSADILDNPDTGVKEGNITLNLYGGTIENVFGGSNINGKIEGNIIVNVIDSLSTSCPLKITNIYGGSNLTDYVPDSVNHVAVSDPNRISPVVNLVHSKYGISGNVYGGSRGDAAAQTPTKLMTNPLVNIGYDATSMDGYIPATYLSCHASLLTTSPRAIVAGSVFGGGDAAKVVGNTAIFLRNRAKVFGNVYGGGNMGEVEGDTKVIVNGERNGGE